ncbi:LuxR C-terminal-related transcriptional regulator [Rhodococcus sp. FXJ9.536]|uniref:LuxR C-terminal-related transcriptional regulator n=1 Tax=Rhodococcus tibetensis TaxID=2965064 RepID=A0ABT1QBP5_9NOCA|nr:LuxR C-terminal-related transcriptional regulator [Rhodococcus sp. FXJ9.536]
MAPARHVRRSVRSTRHRGFTDVGARGLTIDQAVDLALGTRQEAAPAPTAETSPLTHREQQIAELLAEGLSNRQIADALVISRRTVDGHAEHILDKLAVSSRTQVAAWVAARAHPRPVQAGG